MICSGDHLIEVGKVTFVMSKGGVDLLLSLAIQFGQKYSQCQEKKQENRFVEVTWRISSVNETAPETSTSRH
jgi:hypothetical protein